MAALARKAHIHVESRFSDHAPLTIDDDVTLQAGPRRDGDAGLK